MELLERLAQTLGVNGTILYQWIIFIAAIVVMYVFLFRPTVAYLDARESKMADTGDKFDAMRNEIDEMTSKYDARVKQALVEASDIRALARKQAEHQAEEIVDGAKGEAAATIEKMKGEIAKTEDQVRQDLQKDAEEIANMILGRLLV